MFLTLPEGRCLTYRRSITHCLSDERPCACSNLIIWHALNEIKLLLKVSKYPALCQTSCKASCRFLLIFLKAHRSCDRVQMDLTSAAVVWFKTSKLTINYWAGLSSYSINYCSPGTWGIGIKSIHNLCGERAYSFFALRIPFFFHDTFMASICMVSTHVWLCPSAGKSLRWWNNSSRWYPDGPPDKQKVVRFWSWCSVPRGEWKPLRHYFSPSVLNVVQFWACKNIFAFHPFQLWHIFDT